MIAEYIIPLVLMAVLLGIGVLSIIETFFQQRKDCGSQKITYR